MLRGPVRLLTVLACALVLAGCGGTTYVDTPGDDTAPLRGAGWQGIEPIPLDLPTDDPVGRSGTQQGTVVRYDADAPTLVNIWASFCEPCKDELPMLEQANASGAIRVLGFTRDTRRERAVEALDAAGVTFPTWMDPGAEVALAVGRIPVNAIPTSILVRDGKAIAVHIGPFPDKATLLAALEIR